MKTSVLIVSKCVSSVKSLIVFNRGVVSLSLFAIRGIYIELKNWMIHLTSLGVV